ncbi:MAG TPA: hypothetical protein PK728_07120 [Bacillota bacterium]|nr:hypothetical protein [Bacillota bacterium]
MEPLSITIYLSSPLIFPVKTRPFPLMFDSLLIEIMSLRAGQVEYPYNEYSDDPYAPETNAAGVPLAVAGSKKKYYCASAMEIDQSAARWTSLSVAGRTDWPDEENLSRYARSLRRIEGSNLYRGALELLKGIIVPAIRFHCVGDKAVIVDLLKDLKSVGTKTSIGMGRVAKVTVRESEKDYSVFDARNYPARPIPVSEAENKNSCIWLRDHCSYKPPYWLADNKGLCWVPPIYRWLPIN